MNFQGWFPLGLLGYWVGQTDVSVTSYRKILTSIFGQPIVCFLDNQEKIFPSTPVPDNIRGPGDVGKTGQIGPLPCTDFPLPTQSLSPFRDGSPAYGLLFHHFPAISFFPALCSIYQLLIRTFSHFLDPHKTGPIFQNQSQRSQDNKTKQKTKGF